MEFKYSDMRIDVFTNIAATDITVIHVPTGIKRKRNFKHGEGTITHRARREMIEEIRVELSAE